MEQLFGKRRNRPFVVHTARIVTIESLSKSESIGLEREIILKIESPVSFQSKRKRIDALGDRVRTEIAQGQRAFFVGDAEVCIQWEIHQGNRYLTNRAADVDNIIKPVLDALSGPDGVLVDDCQVRYVSSQWKDWDVAEDQAQIVVRALTGSVIERADICFVRVPVRERLYVPFPRSALKDAESSHSLSDRLGDLASSIGSWKREGFHKRDCCIFGFSRLGRFDSACLIEREDCSHPYRRFPPPSPNL